MKTADRKVSIVLATYNGMRYLPLSLESCLKQKYVPFEIIVVVDGSSDETMAFLQRCQDPRLKIISQPNQGHSNALNAGFSIATGEYWGWTSDDNLYGPCAIDEMATYLNTNPEAAMIKAGYYKIDREGKAFGKSTYACACFLYRAEAARKTGPYRHQFKEVNDVDFFMRLQYYGGPIHTLNRYLYKFRFHENSQTSRFQGKRELTSLRMHYDLITRGISRENLKGAFYDRVRRAAIFKDWPTVQGMAAFAADKNVAFLYEYVNYCAWLQTRPGWLLNRIRMALWTRYFAFTLFVRRVLRMQYSTSVNKK